MSMYIQVERDAVYADIGGCILLPAVTVTYSFVARLPDYHTRTHVHRVLNIFVMRKIATKTPTSYKKVGFVEF